MFSNNRNENKADWLHGPTKHVLAKMTLQGSVVVETNEVGQNTITAVGGKSRRLSIFEEDDEGEIAESSQAMLQGETSRRLSIMEENEDGEGMAT